MILQLLLPLFVLSALGTILVKSGWLKPSAQAGLGEFTGRVLIPALLFQGTYQNGLPGAQSWSLLLAFYLPLALVFALFAFSGARDADRASRALAASYGNAAFVGIPVIQQVLGQDALHFAFPIIAFHGLVAFTLYYSRAHAGGRLRDAVLAAVRNPIVVSLMAGLACNLTGLKLPAVVMQGVATLAQATMPCALVALGAALAGFHLGHAAVALRITVAKLGLLPLLVWALTTYVVPLAPEARLVLILIAACPVGINAGVVVSANRADTAAVNAATLLSSLGACLTIPAWLALAMH
ncbi:AEC family transporter [Massilia sp. TS11]|uniref:AEC family transporter n=1 Tax=Massilia sp. TS11 TaxID=2908003 RepID=UPI001EDB8A1D|nr:AEC family transporter [Massilia sp. TS11]MCG2585798.1 AEC family transporter [Massilia sp. TS11]